MTPFGLFGAADGGADHAPVEVPPPPGFRAAEQVVFAVFCPNPFGGSSRPTGGFAQRAGIRYERQVHEMLTDAGGVAIRHNPWIEFGELSGSRRRCSPDALWAPKDEPLALVIEVKSQHMPEAWWQLRRLYQPVVERLWPARQLEVLEICKSFDPAMPFPEKVVQVSNVHEALGLHGKFGVLQWRK